MKWAVTGPASSLGEAPRPCHIREMRLKFTTRTPQPRGCVVTPLNDANPPKARPQERPRERLRELGGPSGPEPRSEEHTSELQSLMRNSYAVFWWQKKTTNHTK